MEEKEMKPCPFCAGPASLGDYRSGPFPDVDPDLCFSVGCANGGCIGHETHIQNFITAGEAIAAWNTRAPQEPQWQQMTPDTKFEDGERIVAVVNGWAKKLLAFSKSSGFEDERGFPVFTSSISDFVRLPK